MKTVMPHFSGSIHPINLRAAAAHEYAALNAFENRILAERLPDDPPIPIAEAIQSWQNMPTDVDLFCWVIWNADGSALVARGEAYVRHTDGYQHRAWFNLAVLPEFRQQGLGRRLLQPIVDVARSAQRRFLETDTFDRVPAGAAFLQRLGANKGQEMHINQLVLTDLDRHLIGQWQTEAAERTAEFDLGFWLGAWPEVHMEAMTGLFNKAMNQQPHDQLDVEEIHFTPEQIRQFERYSLARGVERWTLYVRERKSGAFAGYTQVFWQPARPAILQQDATYVLPEYRNHGLGRWLKAAMLEKVLHERPQVQFVRSGNANSNAPMLKINLALGFKPYMAGCIWQAETEQMAKYLESKPA